MNVYFELGIAICILISLICLCVYLTIKLCDYIDKKNNELLADIDKEAKESLARCVEIKNKHLSKIDKDFSSLNKDIANIEASFEEIRKRNY